LQRRTLFHLFYTAKLTASLAKSLFWSHPASRKPVLILPELVKVLLQ
jgi:hypothetical protein